MHVKVCTKWNGNLQGHGTAAFGEVSIPLAIPTDFGGSGEGLGPKELYLSSTAACFLMALKVTLHHSKIETSHLHIESHMATEGDRNTIIHQLYIAVSSDKDRDRLPAMIKIADKNCLIGGLAKKAGVDVVVELSVTIADPVNHQSSSQTV